MNTRPAFPNYARILSASWRQDIRAVAHRQPGWFIGCRDAALLAAPVFLPTQTHGVVLIYGDPALLVLPGSASLLPALDDAAFAVATAARGRRARDELDLIGRLRDDLLRLDALNASAPSRQDGAVPHAPTSARPRPRPEFPYFTTWLQGAAGGNLSESGSAIDG